MVQIVGLDFTTSAQKREEEQQPNAFVSPTTPGVPSGAEYATPSSFGGMTSPTSANIVPSDTIPAPTFPAPPMFQGAEMSTPDTITAFRERLAQEQALQQAIQENPFLSAAMPVVNEFQRYLSLADAVTAQQEAQRQAQQQLQDYNSLAEAVGYAGSIPQPSPFNVVNQTHYGGAFPGATSETLTGPRPALETTQTNPLYGTSLQNIEQRNRDLGIPQGGITLGGILGGAYNAFDQYVGKPLDAYAETVLQAGANSLTRGNLAFGGMLVPGPPNPEAAQQVLHPNAFINTQAEAFRQRPIYEQLPAAGIIDPTLAIPGIGLTGEFGDITAGARTLLRRGAEEAAPELGRVGAREVAGEVAPDLARRVLPEGSLSEVPIRGGGLPPPEPRLPGLEPPLGRPPIERAPVRPTPALTGEVQSPAAQELLQVMRDAKPKQAEIRRAIRESRGSKFAQMEAMGQITPEQLAERTSLLRGADRPANITLPVRPELWPDLFGDIERSTALTTIEKTKAQNALKETLFEGRVPTQGEIQTYRKVFGDEFAKEINSLRSMSQRARQEFLDAAGIPRSIIASFDLSAPGRQGALFIGRKEWWQAWGPMIKAWIQPEYASKVDDALRATGEFAGDAGARARALRRDEAGLSLAQFRNPELGATEEAFQTTLAERLPLGIGNIVKRSESSYVTFLNKLRADVFDNWSAHLAKLESSGAIDAAERADAERQMASWINIATGRGNISPGLRQNAYMTLANQAFFSPRLAISRVQALASPVTLVNPRVQARVKAQIIRDLSSFIGAGMGTLYLAYLGGASIELDPRSSDFAKVKIGHSRIDPWAGFQQYITFANRFASGKIKPAGGTRVYDASRGATVQRFARGKLNPGVPAVLVDLITGETFLGDEVNGVQDLYKQIPSRFLPITVQDLIDGLTKEGVRGGLLSMPNFIGVNAGTYETAAEKAQAEYDAWLESLSPRERAALAKDLQDYATKPEQALTPEQALRNDLPPTWQKRYDEANPEGAAARQKALERSAAKGDETAQRVVDAQQIREEQIIKPLTDLETQLRENAIPPEQYASDRRDILDRAYAQLDQVWRGYEPGPVKDTLDEYRQIVEAHKVDGEVDWDAVEAAVSQLPAGKQRIIEQETGIGYTPTDRQYRDDMENVAETTIQVPMPSGQTVETSYFDLRDELFKEWLNVKGADASWAYDDYWNAVYQNYVQQRQERGMSLEDARNAARVDLRIFKQPFDDKLSELRQGYREHAPAVGDILRKWGIAGTGKEETRASLQR